MSAASRVRDERGMSLIEILVTALILVLGVLAIFTVVISSRNLTTKAETLESATHIAEQELEAMQSLTWTAMAHPAAPASGPTPHTVSGTPPRYQISAGVTEPLAVTAGAAIDGAAKAWSDGRLSGDVWRYVTWVDDPCCAGTQNYKRLTAVVTVDNPRGISTPVAISTLAAKKEGV